MMEVKPPESYDEFVEVDPTGRYGRYNEILGKGASKTVYRAFDEFEGIEVAWNQVKLNDFLQSREDLERLYCEIHLLKTLKHKNIMKFYTSWVDTANRNINFVTEMFTSGTLRQYRQKHKRVNIRAVKHWCRQILRGLLYLHSHDPPVIHRDLKCDNIFINGNQGEVKIGDLGLAAILRKSHAAHCVGTPEFMAPEVYEEEYNELVDIYSFGMCLLEMVTFEYPYSECSHPVQIYKKVITGKKPEALYKVTDPEVRQFVEKCLATVSRRLPARELLKDPFLQISDCGSDVRLVECSRDVDDIGPHLRQPHFDPHHSHGYLVNGVPNDLWHETENGWDYDLVEIEPHGIELFASHEDELYTNVDITIKGKRRDDDSIFLRLRIADKEGRIRNIYFPFDMETDTALSVATEMVAELDITDQDVTKIADMIDGEISSLVPEWKPGPGIEESPGCPIPGFCYNCASNGSSSGSLLEYLSLNNLGTKNLQVVQCSCASMHGRFEEITYQVEGSEQCVTEGAPVISSQSDGPRYMDIWAQHGGHDLSSPGSRDAESDEESEQLDQKVDESVVLINNHIESHSKKSGSQTCNSSNGLQAIGDLGDRSPPPVVDSSAYTFPDNYENEIRQELGWLKAKYMTELRELSNQQFGGKQKASSSPTALDYREQRIENGVIGHSVSIPLEGESYELFLKSYALGKHLSSYLPSHDSKNFDTSNNRTPADNNAGTCRNSCPDLETQRAQHREAIKEDSPEHMITAKNFYAGFLVPHSIHRTRSLPVDAVDF